MSSISDLRRRLRSLSIEKFPRVRRVLYEKDLLARKTSNPWLVLQEQIGPASYWPNILRKKFWCSNLGYKDRAYFAAFIVGNGLDLDFLLEVLSFTNSSASEKRKKQIRAVVEWLSEDSAAGQKRREKYFYYDWFRRRVFFLSGEPKQVSTSSRSSSVDARQHLQASSVGYHC